MLIGLDWGTSALRAYLLDGAGTVIDRAAAPLGIMKVPNGDFEGVLEEIAGRWLDAHPDAPVLACGMIGSRQGWREVPYVSCPAGLPELAAGLAAVPTRRGRPVHLIPGVARVDADGVPDVMRGEETMIFGAAGSVEGENGVFVLPGTHSKWARLENGRIAWFATFMTGEVFAVLRAHSILGRLMSGEDHDPESFQQGVRYALAQPAGRGGLLRRLFSARTLGLFDRLPASGLHSYLSGLLIGTEACEVRACLGNGSRTDATTAVLLGSAELVPLYAEALAAAGFTCVPHDEADAARGLHRIAQVAGLSASVAGASAADRASRAAAPRAAR